MATAAVGCEDDVMAGREGPKPEGRELLRVELEAMRAWLTREWLCKPEPHPLRAVWKRGDAGASLELQSIAMAMSRILPKAGRSLLAEWKRRVMSSDVSLIRGALFEIYAAGLFDGSERRVRTVNDKQPGYDFAVEFNGGGTLRVSCKSRDDSEEERRASVFFDKLRDRIVSTIPPGGALSINLFAPPNAPAALLDVDRVFARVREGARLARRGLDLPPSAADDWSLDVNGLRCLHPGLVFREGDRLSFSLLVGVPVDRARIVERFRQKVEGAVRNLQDHCDTGPDRTNVLLYRIPHLLPIDDAAAAVLSVLETNTSTSTASVFLYRALFSTVHEQRASYYLGHELREVVNARAAVAASAVVPGGTFALQVLGGKPQHVEPVQMVSDGEKSFPVADMWMRLYGRHYLRRPDWRGGDLEIIRPHGVAIWFANGHAISGGIAEKQLTEAIPDEVSLL